MTPETEAMIARVRELDAACSVEGNNIPILLGQIADLAPQLTTALEAESKRAEFWKTALDAEYARRIDAEKRADALQDDKDVLTGQLQEARRRADAEHERAEVLQSQVDNADTNLEQVRMIWKARADAAEAKLKVAREGRPTVVCLCGSSKHPELHMRVMMDETLAGRIVIPMGLYGHADFPSGAKAATNDGDESTAVKQMLDTLHHRKIDLADEVLVLTVEGYIGNSTRREIEYAEKTGKRVRFYVAGATQLEP